MAGSKLKPPRGGSDKTEATIALSLPDPNVDNVSSFPKQGSDALRSKLLKCTIVHDELGLNIRALADHLQGMTPLNIGTFKFISLRTKKRYFVLTTQSPENVYEVAPSLMGVDFKKRCILDSNGKQMYLSLVTAEEVIMLQSLSENRGKRAIDYSSTEEFQRKLATCHAEEFDCHSFAKRVKMVIDYKDEYDQPYTLVIAGKKGENERTYKLYVSPNEETKVGFKLQYGNKTLYLTPEL